jgi:hypothetical protein
VTSLIGSGTRKVIIDLSGVGYIDSATIGCLMDLYRQMNAAGGAVRLAGVQKRVETMLTMTGALNFLQAHPTKPGRWPASEARHEDDPHVARHDIPLDNDLLASSRRSITTSRCSSISIARSTT